MDIQNNAFFYYDALVSNYNSPNKQIPLIFNDTRSSPLIKDTTGYCMSIVRFTLDTNLLPVFIPTMQTNSSTQTVYSITMQYNGIYFQQYMQFLPQDTSSISANYFHVYNFQYVCMLINNTFTQCYEGLVQKCELQGINLDPTIETPIITYEATTQLFTITADSNYGINNAGSIQIYFNNAMQSLFLFNAYFKSLSDTNGLNYLLIINSNNIIVQEISSIGNLSPILSIVFVSTQLPIIQNITSNPNVYINGIIKNQNSSNTAFSIVTDMVPNNFIYTPNIIYVPSGSYRYISLIPGARISNIDLSVYWLNKQGDLNQVYLSTGSSCTVKMMFQKMH